jgi:hypothetical protein
MRKITQFDEVTETEQAIIEIKELERKNSIMLAALRSIAGYDKLYNYQKDNEGICPYGCDTPNIAQKAISEVGE